MKAKEVVNYARKHDYCSGCQYENNNKGRCMNCVHRDFWVTVAQTFEYLRKIHKVTKEIDNCDYKNI